MLLKVLSVGLRSLSCLFCSDSRKTFDFGVLSSAAFSRPFQASPDHSKRVQRLLAHDL